MTCGFALNDTTARYRLFRSEFIFLLILKYHSKIEILRDRDTITLATIFSFYKKKNKIISNTYNPYHEKKFKLKKILENFYSTKNYI